MIEYFTLHIKRQDNPEGRFYWEDFKIKYKPNMNIVSSLMEIQKNPVNSQGENVNPVIWECNCFEEVCGACAMVINNVPRQGCSALIDKLLEKYGENKPITIEPLSKFPVIRDLMIDKTILFDNLRRVRAWIPLDGSFDLGRGPRYDEHTRRWAYEISRCMTCGCCTEACPNFNSKSSFIGPNAIAQVRLFNAHPLGKMQKDERLAALIGHGGIQECGNAQNCLEVCPKNIPLTRAIATLNMEANLFAIKRFFQT